jgi:hypothetical protein
MTGAMVIGGDKFSSKPGDWADVKRREALQRTGAMTGAKVIRGDRSSGKPDDWADVRGKGCLLRKRKGNVHWNVRVA